MFFLSRSALPYLVLAVMLSACGKSDGSAGPGTGEQEYVEGEVVRLESAFAAKDQAGIAVGCTSVTIGTKRMPEPLVRKIEKLCYVDAPRFHLERAIAEVKDARAKSPALSADITCMQLFVKDAVKAMEKLPTPDPGVKRLVDEYARLCPNAKLR